MKHIYTILLASITISCIVNGMDNEIHSLLSCEQADQHICVEDNFSWHTDISPIHKVTSLLNSLMDGGWYIDNDAVRFADHYDRGVIYKIARSNLPLLFGVLRSDANEVHISHIPGTNQNTRDCYDALKRLYIFINDKDLMADNTPNDEKYEYKPGSDLIKNNRDKLRSALSSTTEDLSHAYESPLFLSKED